MVCIHTAHMRVHVRMHGCAHTLCNTPAYKYIHTRILEKDPSWALYMVSTRKMVVTIFSDLIELLLKNHLLQLLSFAGGKRGLREVWRCAQGSGHKRCRPWSPGPLVPALCPAGRGNDKPPWRRTGVLSREGTAPQQSLSPGDRRAAPQSALVPCVLLWGWDEIQKSMRNGTETNKGGRTKSFSPLERDRKDYYN